MLITEMKDAADSIAITYQKSVNEDVKITSQIIPLRSFRDAEGVLSVLLSKWFGLDKNFLFLLDRVKFDFTKDKFRVFGRLRHSVRNNYQDYLMAYDVRIKFAKDELGEEFANDLEVAFQTMASECEKYINGERDKSDELPLE